MHKTLNILLVLILATSLTACSRFKQVQFFKKEVERTPLDLDMPAAVELEKLNWIVIDEENAKDVFAELKEQGIDPVLIGLTDDGYATLSLNNARVRNYIILSNKINAKYKEYYEGDRGTEQPEEE